MAFVLKLFLFLNFKLFLFKSKHPHWQSRISRCWQFSNSLIFRVKVENTCSQDAGQLLSFSKYHQEATKPLTKSWGRQFSKKPVKPRNKIQLSSYKNHPKHWGLSGEPNSYWWLEDPRVQKVGARTMVALSYSRRGNNNTLLKSRLKLPLPTEGRGAKERVENKMWQRQLWAFCPGEQKEELWTRIIQAHSWL